MSRFVRGLDGERCTAFELECEFAGKANEKTYVFELCSDFDDMFLGHAKYLKYKYQ